MDRSGSLSQFNQSGEPGCSGNFYIGGDVDVAPARGLGTAEFDAFATLARQRQSRIVRAFFESLRVFSEPSR
jgi:hypothetical protein